MKKLNSINWVNFKEDKIYLEDTPITIGVNIEKWLNEYSNISFEYENYSKPAVRDVKRSASRTSYQRICNPV